MHVSRGRASQAVPLLLLWLCFASPVWAAVRLASPFGDHMVLPRDAPVTIWGTGAPGGDTVRVHIAGQTATAHSDWQGRWQAQLAPMKAGGPYQMIVEVGGVGPFVASSAANSTGGAELNDVLVGDVITPDAPAPDVSGSAAAVQAKDAVPAVRYAFVRVYKVRAGSTEGHWASVWQGRLPADAASFYEAGQAHYNKTGVPVGVVETASPLRCAPSTACSAH